MPTELTRKVAVIGDKIRVSPPILPSSKIGIQPDDLTKSTPYGNGVYGYQGREGGNQFTNAPSQEACGGVVYFGNHITKEDFEAFMRIMGVQSRHPSKDFAVFTAESAQPGQDGYLVQMRVVSKFGLRYMFGVLTDADYENFPEQELNVVEALWSFIEHERKRWGTSWMGEDKGLAGKFGGDGYFACEELAFGFMMENEYHGVYRIWSRAWLVTK